MTDRRSVSRRLKRGLGLIGLVGTFLLLAAVVFFYSFTFAHLDAQAAMARASREMLEHVALPVAILMIPVTVLVLRVIRQAFRPLEEVAAEIEAVQGHERGFRIDNSQMPTEALPFTSAVNDRRSARKPSPPMSRTNCAHRSPCCPSNSIGWSMTMRSGSKRMSRQCVG